MIFEDDGPWCSLGLIWAGTIRVAGWPRGRGVLSLHDPTAGVSQHLLTELHVLGGSK